MNDLVRSFDWLRNALIAKHESKVNLILSLELGPTTAQAWEQVCTATGLSETDVAELVSIHFGIEHYKPQEIKLSVVSLIPETLARRFTMIPVNEQDGHLKIATIDPFDEDCIQQAGFVSGRSVEPIVASPTVIHNLIVEKYKENKELASVVAQATKHVDGDTILVKGRNLSSLLSENTPTTEKLFLLILREALNHRVSDIHIQPFVGGAAVRFRIDGVMKQIKSMPLDVMRRLIRHIKALADMDVTNTHTPQDGRLTLVADETQRDLRVSTLPVEQGERLVIRILSHDAKDPGSLNFEESQVAMFRRSMRATSGMILMTGPTGSGKTTTLYAMLGLLNHDTTNIMSVEDPVEIKMRGVSQSSVRPEQGLTFPSVLRSMLRQDPDVILVGEIRDSETAELAMRASLTGHLVLSTLHTIDAITTVPRLVDLGLSPILLADSLICVVNQRLVRRLCDLCKIEVNIDSAEDIELLYLELSDTKSVQKSVGCESCSYTGFSGRLPLTQVWTLTDDVKNLLRAGEIDNQALTKIAEQHGLQTLHASGRSRIDDGLTSVREAARALGPAFWAELGSEDRSAFDDIEKSDRVSMKEKILIMEPDDSLRFELSSELESRGYVVTSVSTAEQSAFEISKGEPLDLMLLDIENQRDTPMQSFKNLRSSLSWVGSSVVLLLPSNAEAVETLLEIHGASDYLIKPVSASKICDQVEAALKRRHV